MNGGKQIEKRQMEKENIRIRRTDREIKFFPGDLPRRDGEVECSNEREIEWVRMPTLMSLINSEDSRSTGKKICVLREMAK